MMFELHNIVFLYICIPLSFIARYLRRIVKYLERKEGER